MLKGLNLNLTDDPSRKQNPKSQYVIYLCSTLINNNNKTTGKLQFQVQIGDENCKMISLLSPTCPAISSDGKNTSYFTWQLFTKPAQRKRWDHKSDRD